MAAPHFQTTPLLEASCLLSISEVASPGPGWLLSVLPSTWQGLAQGHCSNSILAAQGCRCRTALSTAGFVFHSFLSLGILCSIKPSACNTAGRAPSRASCLSSLPASASCILWDLTPVFFLLSVSLLGLNSMRVYEWPGWRLRHLLVSSSLSSNKGVPTMSTFLLGEKPR